MTTIHYDIADSVAAMLPADSELRIVLRQRSSVYGTVSGALETLMGCSVRGQETDAAFAALVDAIHAPRTEAETIASELYRLGRDAVSRRYAAESL
jgi:hypothetical protein